MASKCSHFLSTSSVIPRSTISSARLYRCVKLAALVCHWYNSTVPQRTWNLKSHCGAFEVRGDQGTSNERASCD